MTGETLRQVVTIKNPHGFHMRPVQDFVAIAGPFTGTVTVGRRGAAPVNGKSMWALFSLVAENGAELEIEVTGPDAARVFEKLMQVFERNYDEQ